MNLNNKTSVLNVQDNDVQDPDFFGVPQMITLEKVLYAGLEDLLRKVIEINILDPPYGRPLVAKFPGEEEEGSDQDSSDNEGDLSQADDCDATLDIEHPKFSYEYGFNPLIYLGTFLKKNNPTYVLRKQRQKEESFLYLQKRAKHALKQYDVLIELQSKVVRLRSGVIQGPVSGSCTFDSITLWAKTSKAGNVVFQVSESQDFRYITQTAVLPVDYSTEMAGKVTIHGLSANQLYHYRVCLHNPGLGYMGPDDNCFALGKFRTTPDPYEDPRQIPMVSFVIMSNLPSALLHFSQPKQRPASSHGNFSSNSFQLSEIQEKVLNSVLELRPTLMLWLGDMVFSETVPSSKKIGVDAAYTIYRGMYNQVHRTVCAHPVFKEISVCNAWNDSSHKSGIRLRKEEEGTGKGHVSLKTMTSMKKLSSRKPSSKAKGASDSHSVTVKVMDEQWPVVLGKTNTYLTPGVWRDFRVGGHVHIFLLDTRNGVLGKSQSDWLKYQVVESSCTWKIICCGVPMAFYPISLKEAARSRGSISHPYPQPSVVGLPAHLSIRESTAETDEDGLESEEASLASNSDYMLQEIHEIESTLDDKEAAATKIQALAKGRKVRIQSRNSLDSTGSPQPPEYRQGLFHLAEHFSQRMIRNIVFLTGSAAYPYAFSYTMVDQVQKVPMFELNCSPSIKGAQSIPVPISSTELQKDVLMSLKDCADTENSFGRVSVSGSGNLRFEICKPEGQVLRTISLSPDH